MAFQIRSRLLTGVFTIALLTASGSLGAASEPSKQDILKLMSAQDVQRTGLNKLTARQRMELNRWVWSVVDALALEEIKILQQRKAAAVGDARPAGSDITEFSQVEGAILVADDGKMLGKITSNAFDSASLLNEFGDFGNKFNSDSIFNEFGPYGNKFSNLSPFNEFTTTPPKIILQGRMVAYLTKNKALSPRLAPSLLLAWLAEKK